MPIGVAQPLLITSASDGQRGHASGTKPGSPPASGVNPSFERTNNESDAAHRGSRTTLELFQMYLPDKYMHIEHLDPPSTWPRPSTTSSIRSPPNKQVTQSGSVGVMSSFEMAVRRFLEEAVLSRAEVQRFLDPRHPAWARFDAELGYIPNDCAVPDNVDGAISFYTYGDLGERRLVNYATQRPRINTYGDSMTQCHQVSDGETWQEQLAAHFGEPVRNFGVGGYGVYQATRRLQRVEATAAGTEYVVLNIFLDDHYRSLDAYRLLRLGKWWRDYDSSLVTSMFHANPWQHVRLDPSSGAIVSRPNSHPTPESLHDLCDTERVYEAYRDDFVVQLLVGFGVGDFPFLEQHAALASLLGVPMELQDSDRRRRTAQALYDACAFHASTLILEETRDFLGSRGKQLLVLLSYAAPTVSAACRGETRPDAPFVAALTRAGIPYVDTLRSHVEDYRSFSVDPDTYAARYFNGHYSPIGNHFFAFAVKDALVDWLSPKPPAYRDPQASFAVQAGRLAT